MLYYILQGQASPNLTVPCLLQSTQEAVAFVPREVAILGQKPCCCHGSSDSFSHRSTCQARHDSYDNKHWVIPPLSKAWMEAIHCGILTGLPAGIKAVSKPAGTTGTSAGGSSAGGAGGSSAGGAGGSPAGSAGAASFHEEEPQSGEGSLDIYIYIYIYILIWLKVLHGAVWTQCLRGHFLLSAQ